MSTKPIYQDPNRSFEDRAKDLVSRMSLNEKVSQMIHNAAAVDHLDIPAYNWWSECLHGVSRAGVATVFPQPIGLAACFDEKMMESIGDIIAIEARIKYNAAQEQGDVGIGKGLTFWAPNINIFRDPRWGRGHETYGEDPYLTSRLAVSFIQGLQGSEKYLKTAAGIKHYAVHSGPESVRHTFNAVVSQKDLFETYLPAFEACIKEAKVETVMGAYNRVNGEACCASEILLHDILRDAWNFEGHVVSDCWAIKDLHENHNITNSIYESVALAVSMGCDLNCGDMYGFIVGAVEKGLLPEDAVTRSVERLMKTRFKLGMFDTQSNKQWEAISYSKLASKAHRDYAVNAARKSLVLLKNRNNILPLNCDSFSTLAIIGPNADSRKALLGNYNGTPLRHITVLDAFHQQLEDTVRIHYAEGCHLYNESVEPLAQPDDRLSEALKAAAEADVVIVCLGMDATIEGEEGDVSNAYGSGDKPDLNLPGQQQKLLEEISAVGKPVILILLSGSALAIDWAEQHTDAIIQAWYPGGEGGTAIADLVLGNYSPSGRLPVTFYKKSTVLPEFGDYSMKNRTYKFLQEEPLFPFGYGLSYTRFAYSDIKLDKEHFQKDESIDVQITIHNIGSFDGEETLQLYVRKCNAFEDTAIYQLRRFRKTFLKQNEKCEISFLLSWEDFSFVDAHGVKNCETGPYEIFIGGQQPDSRSSELTGNCVQKKIIYIN